MNKAHGLPQFTNLVRQIEQSAPLFEEYPERTTDEAALAQVNAWTEAARGNPRADGKRASMQELAWMCHALALQTDDPSQTAWYRHLMGQTGVALYLMLRAYLPYHPRHAALRIAFARVAQAIRQDGPLTDKVLAALRTEQDMLLDLPADSDPVRHLLDAALAKGTLLGVFTADQRLGRRTPLYAMLRAAYFQECAHKSYLLDGEEFLRAMERAEDAERRRMLLHFLQVHQVQPYPESITLRLVDWFGRPDEPPEESLWLQLAGKDADGGKPLDALVLWYRQWLLKRHLPAAPVKEQVFGRYLPYLRHLRVDEARQVMELDFGSFVIVDIKEIPLFSWVCDTVTLQLRHDTLVQTMRAQLQPSEQERAIRLKRIPEARDFIIEQENGELIRLVFEEVGRLYVCDLLDIKLGRMEHEVWGVV